MKQHKSNLKSYAGIVAFLVLFTACNSGRAVEEIADTASTAAYSSGDSMQANMRTDTAAMAGTSADTAATQSAAKSAMSSSKKKGSASVTVELVEKNHKVAMDKSGIYEFSEVMPVYNGGQNAIETYVSNNIQYPQPALDNNKEGRVVVAFTVDENGKVINAHTTGTELGDGLDEEAVRVVSSMPKWVAGTVKGKAVKTKVTLPITFQIQE